MSQSVSYIFLSAALILSACLQSDGVAVLLEDSSIYDQFASSIIMEYDMAVLNLNQSQVNMENITLYSSYPTKDIVRSNLSKCYSDAAADATGADPECLQNVAQDMLQIVNDSIAELTFCSSLSYGLQEVENINGTAEQAKEQLLNVTNNILKDAKPCVSRYPNNPIKQYICMKIVKTGYGSAWDNATASLEVASNKLHGLSLRLLADIDGCDQGELNSLDAKCVEITSSVQTCIC